jgi:Yip1-like protein
MALIDRAKNMILTPKSEWDVVAAEPTQPAQVVTGYVLPLAAAYAIASFIGAAMVMGYLGGMAGIGFALVAAIYHLVMAVVMVFVLGFIIDALAPTFTGQKNFPQAVKVAAYAYTPIWVFGLLTVIPLLGWLAVLVGVAYALYLLYLGLPRLMKVPAEKSVPYVVVVIVVGIVLGIVIGLIGGMVTGMGHPRLGGYSSAMPYDRDSRIGKMNDFAAKMEEAGKRMDAAQKSGDSQKQMEAAMGALGTALSGGKGVEPVQLDVLKPMLPDKFAGLPRKSQKADRSGVAGLMAAKVEGGYGDDSGKHVDLQITDTGGAAGLMGLAGWATMGASSESEDDQRIERMRKEGNRVVREEVSKRGGTNSYSVILADRFVVEARGEGVDGKEIKSAVNGLDLAKLESMK